MKDYQKVLVGIDGSKQSDAAFQRAIDVAKKNKATLIIARILNIDKYAGIGMTVNVTNINRTIEEDLLSNINEEVSFLVKQAKDAGINDVITDVSSGNAKIALSENLIEKYGVDLIVVGATGTNAIERMLVGSTTNFIIQHAKSDVMVVRE